MGAGLAGLLLALMGLTPAETRGRDVFEHGLSPSGGEIVAMVGADVAIPGLACATCHGPDGAGRPEGGVQPADVRWAALSRALAASPGRSRPAYDDAGLVRAIGLGLDPGGTRLDRVMPRYRLSTEDMRDLLAYLRALGERAESGVGEDALAIGVLLGAAPAPGLVLGLTAWADELNGRGGVFARRIQLRWFQGGVAELEALPGDQLPLAFLGGVQLDERDGAGAWVRAQQVPLVRASSLVAEPGFNPYVFELGAPFEEELRALLELAAQRGAMPVGVWPSPRRDGVSDLCKAPACTLAETLADARAVLVLAHGLPAADGRGRLVLVPSALAALEVPALDGHVSQLVAAAAVLPDEVAARAERLYRLSASNRVDQWSALRAGRVLEEALVRCGRNLSRAGLRAALESLRGFDTGFGPKVSFDASRRHGTQRVRLVRFESPRP